VKRETLLCSVIFKGIMVLLHRGKFLVLVFLLNGFQQKKNWLNVSVFSSTVAPLFRKKHQWTVDRT